MAFTDIDVDHDIPDGLGFNEAGTIRYIDKTLFEAIVADEAKACGLTSEQIVDCLVANIEAEKTALDADPNAPWHDVSIAAHRAEAAKVKEFGGDIDTYDKALAPLFIACKRKEAKNPPQDMVDLETVHGETPSLHSGADPSPEKARSKTAAAADDKTRPGGAQ